MPKNENHTLIIVLLVIALYVLLALASIPTVTIPT